MSQLKAVLSELEAQEMSIRKITEDEDVGVRIIIPHHSNHGQFLFVKNREEETIGKRAGWGIPGGGVRSEETPLKGVMRELEEEVGFEKADYQFSKNVFGYRKRSLFNTDKWYYTLIFSISLELSAELRKFTPDPVGDIIDRRWFNPSKDFERNFEGLFVKKSGDVVYQDHVITLKKWSDRLHSEI